MLGSEKWVKARFGKVGKSSVRKRRLKLGLETWVKARFENVGKSLVWKREARLVNVGKSSVRKHG